MSCQTNIHGTFNQTLFLGCSVQSFSVSAGYNEQVSELTVRLVQDLCESPTGTTKVYYNLNLEESEWTDADPGFFGKEYDIIGTPVYFRVAEFEFSGLVQSWEQIDSTTEGHPVFSVKIVDPRQILEGTEVIIGHYTGSTLNTYNVLNVFGYYEGGTDTACSPPTFGDSLGNENGMPWNLIRLGIMNLTGSVVPVSSTYCWTGRLVYRGLFPAPPEGMGVLQGTISTGATAMPVANYCIDISEMPITPSYYKIAGTNVKLMDVLSTVCQDAGVDFYIEMLPLNIGLEIVNLIKVRTVDRTIQPDLNAISSFIENAEGFVSANQGRESRNETVAKIVIGDFKQGLYEKEYSCGDTSTDLDSCVISPFWGFQSDGVSYIRTEYDADGNYQFEANVNDLLVQMINPFANTTVTVNEKELQYALAGFESWMTWSAIEFITNPANDTMFKNLTTVYPAIANAGLWNFQHVLGHLNNLIDIVNGKVKLLPQDILALRAALAPDIQEDMMKDLNMAYGVISTYANEYYGKQWMVRVDEVCSKLDPESGQIINSREPSDGGWNDTGVVLGLSDPLLELFRLDDGRIMPFVRIDNVTDKLLDFTVLDPSTYGIANDSGYLIAQIEPKWVFEDYANQTGPRAVIKIDAVRRRERDIVLAEDVVKNAQGLIDTIKKAEGDAVIDNDEAKAILNEMAGIFLSFGKEYEIAIPSAACIPSKSNFEVYGPWKSNNLTPPPGRVDVVVDRGLAPWEYGGLGSMITAGTFLANEAVTAMVQGEMGSVTIAGYPTKPLFSELLYSGNTHLYENRTFAGGSVYKYEFGINNIWNGTQGPQITNIDVEVSVGGLQTTYRMRTYTPRYGLFARQNAERLKNVGRLRTEFSKRVNIALSRGQVFTNKRARVIANMAGGQIAPGAVILHGADGPQRGVANRELHGSPHAVLGGSLHPFGGSGASDYRRTNVVSESWIDMTTHLSSENYKDHAIMSLDGLLRPVSLSGSGGLPRFGNALGHCQTVNTAGAQPPIAGSYDLDISQGYLNPLLNPGSAKHGTSNGHDIDILARETACPTGTMVIPIAGIDNADSGDYSDDYRFICFKGPMVMHGWGYDLNGKPVPNKADTESATSGGTFTQTNLQDEFMDDWLRKSHTWPVGPVDLRWDRKRGVWTAPPAFRLLVGQMSGDMDINDASGTARMIQGETLYDANGTVISTPTFTVTNVTNSVLKSGDKFLAYYDPEQCQYYPIANSSGAEIIRFRTTQEKAYGANVSGIRINQDLTDFNSTPIYLLDTVGQWGVSMSGAKGWGYKLPDTQKVTGVGQAGQDLDAYEIGFIESKARYVAFKLRESMGKTTAGEALAEWDDEGTRYWGDAVNGQNPWIDGTGIVKDTQGIYLRALTGASGIAVYNEKSNSYEIVRCQTKAEWVRFTLNGAAYTTPLIGGALGNRKAYGTVIDYGGSTLRNQDPTVDDTAAANLGGGPTIIVQDDIYNRWWKYALGGATGLAVLDDATNIYRISEIQTKAEFVMFRSQGAEYSQPFDTPNGGPVTVTMIGYALGQQPVANNGDIEVIDSSRIFKRHLASGTGLAIFDEWNNRYVVVEAQKKAEHIVFKTTGTACTVYDREDDTWTVDLLDYGRDQRPADINDNINVKNKAKFSNVPANATGIATYDDVDDEYHITAVQTLPYAIVFKTTSKFTDTDDPFVVANIDTAFTKSYTHAHDTAPFNTACITSVRGLEGNCKNIETGATGIAFLTHDEGNNFWYTAVSIQQQSSNLIEFIVAAPLIGASTDATLIKSFNGLAPGAPLTVWDELGKFKNAPINATGLAAWDQVNDKYVIVNCQLPAEGIKFTATSIADTGTTVTPTDYWRGLNPGSVTVVDPCNNLPTLACITGEVIATWNQEDNYYEVVEVENTFTLAGKDAAGDAAIAIRPRKLTFGDCFAVDTSCDDFSVDPKHTAVIHYVYGAEVTGTQVTLKRASATVMLCTPTAASTDVVLTVTGCSVTGTAITNLTLAGCELEVTKVPFTVCTTGAPTTSSINIAPHSVDVLHGYIEMDATNKAQIKFRKRSIRTCSTGSDDESTITLPTSPKTVVTSGSCSGGSVVLNTETVYVFCNSGVAC